MASSADPDAGKSERAAEAESHLDPAPAVPAERDRDPMPETSGPPRPDGLASRPRRPSWQTVVNIATVVGVVAGIVFGVAELLTGGEEDNPVPVDERLELVDFEFATKPEKVTILEYVGAESVATVSPYPERPGQVGGENEPYYPLILTLRNPGDDTAILTGLKIVVHEVMELPGCGGGPGGGVAPSLNYRFRFPNALSRPWEQTNPQNFSVAPHSVDALSVSAGPEFGDHTITIWRLSVFGISKGGREVHWGDAVGMHPGEFLQFDLSRPNDTDYSDYIWGTSGVVNDNTVRACARDKVRTLETFTAARAGAPIAVHPMLPGLTAAFRQIGSGNGPR